MSNPLLNLPRYTGPAWRSPSGYSHGFKETGADVLRFEAEELENDWPNQVPKPIWQALQSVSANRVIWVARSPEVAGRYGEPEEWAVGPEARIIHEDEDGALIYAPSTRTAQVQGAKANPHEIIRTLKRIVQVWKQEDPEWVQNGCADVSHALWQICQRKGWPCQIITGTAKSGRGEPFIHAWLNIEGTLFDPVAFASNYRVKHYFAYEQDQAAHVKTISDTFGVETDTDYGFDPDQAIKDLKIEDLPVKKVKTVTALRGEYWFCGGQAMGADGDIGDTNHSGYVIGCIIANHSDELGIGDPDSCDLDEFTDDDLREAGFDEDEIKAVRDRMDPREYGLKHLGWIRVKENNLQVWSLTNESLHNMANGLWDVGGEDNVESEEFCIEVIEPRMVYDGVPYSVISAAVPEGLLPYRRGGMRFAATRQPQPKQQVLVLVHLQKQAAKDPVVWVGVTNSLGDVEGEPTVGDDSEDIYATRSSFGHSGMSLPDWPWRWRYLQGDKTVYWWTFPEYQEEKTLVLTATAEFLHNRGFQVTRHQLISDKSYHRVHLGAHPNLQKQAIKAPAKPKPPAIWIGATNTLGDVKAERTVATSNHGELGIAHGWPYAWRYREGDGTIYWWVLPVEADDEATVKLATEEYFHNRGIQITDHQYMHANENKGYDRVHRPLDSKLAGQEHLAATQPNLLNVPTNPPKPKPFEKPKPKVRPNPKQMLLTTPKPPEPTADKPKVIEDGEIEEGLNIEHPTVAEAVDRYILDNSAEGIAAALADPDYPVYYNDLQRLLHRVYGEGPIPVARKEGYAGGSGEGVGELVSVSYLPTWQGERYYVEPKDVVLAGHEAEGELIVKRKALTFRGVWPTKEKNRTPGRIPLRYKQPIGSNYYHARPPEFKLVDWACCGQAEGMEDGTNRLTCRFHGITERPGKLTTSAKVLNKAVTPGRTGEDLELKPDFAAKYRAVAILQNGKVIEGKPGDNHASIAERAGFPKGMIPGFVDRQGNFVYQYQEDLPTMIAAATESWYREAAKNEQLDFGLRYEIPKNKPRLVPFQSSEDPPDTQKDTAWEDYAQRRDNQLSNLADELKSKRSKRVPWPVVPAARLKKIWTDFSKIGIVRDERGLDEIVDRMITNVARLRSATEMMGHAPLDVRPELEENGYTFTDEEWDDKMAEWMTDSKGNWTISDYGLPQLEKLCQELYLAKTSEDRLLIVDQMLNVIHQRSDLAALFVEGGTATLLELYKGVDLPERRAPLTASAKKQWLTDASGKPLVVYHGSRSPMVEKFDLDRTGTGIVSWADPEAPKAIFFTSSPDNAQFYADSRELPMDINPDAVETYGCEKDGYFYLVTDEQFSEKSENPRAIVNHGPYPTKDEAERAGRAAVLRFNAAQKRGEDMFVRGYYLQMNNPFIGDDSKSPGHWIPIAKKAGHDGVIIRGVIDGYCRSDIYIVFSPNQVKPAPTASQPRMQATAQEVTTLGPLYHGTPYRFDPQALQMNGKAIFFSDNREFARYYGQQKSQESQMDADIKVIAANVSGVVFDPQNQRHIEQVTPFLPPKVTVYNDFGMNADLAIEKWKSFISGVHTEQPFFSEKDLAGKKIGDWLPDNECYDKPNKYELLELTPDEVKCISIGTIQSVQNGEYGFRWDREKNKQFSKEEIAHDIIYLNHLDFLKKYHDHQRHYDFHVQTYTRHPVTTPNNDNWRWLEGDGVFEAVQQAGFNIIKARERGKNTFAVLPSAKITELKQAESQNWFRVAETQEFQAGKKLGPGWLYHNIWAKDIPIIEKEGMQAGSFTDNPGFDFGRDAWVAVRKEDLRHPAEHQYGDVVAYEPQWEAASWRDEIQVDPSGANVHSKEQWTVPASRVALVDKRGRLIRMLGRPLTATAQSNESDAVELLRIYLNEVPGLREEMDRMRSETFEEGWADAIQCVAQARQMLGVLGQPLDEVLERGIDWVEGDQVVANLIQQITSL